MSKARRQSNTQTFRAIGLGCLFAGMVWGASVWACDLSVELTDHPPCVPTLDQPVAIQAPYEFDWQLSQTAKTREGVEIYTYDVPDKALKAFKGVSTVPESPLHVLNVLMDVETMEEWVYKLKRVATTQQNPSALYMAFGTIWPVKRRDVAIHSFYTYQADTGVIDIYSEDTEQYFPRDDDFVRMPELYNHWRLTPLADGWTRLEFETYVDFGGKVPTWIVNLVSKNAPKKTFKGLRKQLATQRYKITHVAQLPFVPKGLQSYREPPTVTSQQSNPVNEGNAL